MVVDLNATEPPYRYRDHEWHWLHSERASRPVISQWIKGNWYSPGEHGAITPQEMWRRGWLYLLPVSFPPGDWGC